MRFDFIWEAILLILVGTILLRISGRKSISQMTVAQTVVMISIGSLMIQPIVDKGILKTIGVAAIFILLLMFMEYIQVRNDFAERVLTGKPKTVIENGEIVYENLKSLRFTVNHLEMRLRQQGINNILDVKTATLEPNGQLGYELMRHAKPLTIGEFEKLMGMKNMQQNNNQEFYNIFDKAKRNS